MGTQSTHGSLRCVVRHAEHTTTHPHTHLHTYTQTQTHKHHITAPRTVRGHTSGKSSNTTRSRPAAPPTRTSKNANDLPGVSRYDLYLRARARAHCQIGAHGGMAGPRGTHAAFAMRV